MWGPPQTTHAATITYDDTGGPFSSGPSWNGGVAPGAGDTAIIDTGGGSIGINFVQNNTVQSLTVRNDDVTIDLAGFTLNTTFSTGLLVGSPATLSNSLAFQSSSPGGSVSTGAVTIQSPSGGTADLIIAGPNTTVSQSSFRNLNIGTNFNGGSASLQIANQATFNGSSSGTITVGSAGLIDVDSNAAFNVNGNIVVDGGTITGLSSQTNFNWADGNFFTVRDGGTVSSFGSSYDSPDSSSWIVTGAGSLVSGSGNTFDLVGGSFIGVDDGGAWLKSIDIEESSTVSVDGAGSTIGRFDVLDGTVTLTNGASSSSSSYTVGEFIGAGAELLTGTLNLLSGSTLNSSFSFNVSDSFNDSNGVVNVSGGGSALTVHDARIGIAGPATGEINVTSGGSYAASGSTTLNPAGTINIDGGTALLGDFVDNGGTINFTSGTFGHNGNFAIEAGSLVGSTVNTSTKSLIFGGTVSINTGSTVNLDGGILSGGAILNSGTLNYTAGILELTGDDLEVDFGGLLTRTPTIGSGQDVRVTNNVNVSSVGLLTIDGGSVTAGTLSNSGLIQMTGLSSLIDGGVVNNNGTLSGTGVVNAALSNNAGGEVRADLGDMMIFNGTGNTNSGLIDNLHGTVQFNGDLINGSSGVIASGSTLKVLGGLTNSGNVAVSGGTSNVFGDITNTASGNISVTGNSAGSFFGTMDNSGDIFVSADSRATFLNDVSGPGSYSGTGVVEFANGFSPGSSPGAVSFAGDVLLSGSTDLSIELAGLIPGSEFDQLNVAGDIMLGGLLDISLLGGFTPSPGDSFQIITAGSRIGEFSSVAGNDLGGGMMLDVVYSPTGVELLVTGGLIGDLDGDGFVGINDLNIVLGNWNQNVPPANPLADPSGDGFVGIDDLNAVLGNWNAGTPPGAQGGASAPEPASGVLLLGLAVGLHRRRA